MLRVYVHNNVVVNSEQQPNTSGARLVHVLNRSLVSPVPDEPFHFGITCTSTTLALVSAEPAAHAPSLCAKSVTISILIGR